MTDKEDAARYRWLKQHTWVEDRDGGWSSHYRISVIPRHSSAPGHLFKCSDLDAAIDREMAKP